jgi:putative glutamine amidotransferase
MAWHSDGAGLSRPVRPPLIGVTGRRWPARLLGTNVVSAMAEADVDIHFVDYSKAVTAAGALVVGLSRDAPVGEMVDRLDGLVLSGGGDVDPELYGAEVEPGCGTVERARDVWELAILSAALERGLPVFGICRGLQVLNVVRGGTLVQDVAPDAGDGHPRFDRPRHEVAHPVDLVDGTLAASLYGPQVQVNSLHHQVVGEVGDGLVASGRSPDATVEALELPGRPVLAVQWHPEALLGADAGFRWLVHEAAAFREAAAPV